MKIAQFQISAEDELFLVKVHGPDISSGLAKQETNINAKRVIVITHNGLYGKTYR
ncbi:MAG: hypothetical protein ABSF61_06775 [Anaerolineales bacterium]|jgi:hypothetical protein